MSAGLASSGQMYEEDVVIEIASPAGAGLPGRRALSMSIDAGTIPVTGIPVLVLHGPITIKAALALTADGLLVRSLAPLVPSLKLRRDEILRIEAEDGHWYALGLGRRVVCIRRVKGATIRLMAPPVPGVEDGTDNLGRLLRAWWHAPNTQVH